MPLGDWQFWVVTLAAVGALAFLVKSLIPKKKAAKTSLTVSAQGRQRGPAA